MNRNEYLKKEANLLELSKSKIVDEVDYNYMVGYRLGYDKAFEDFFKFIHYMKLITWSKNDYILLDYQDMAYLMNEIRLTDDEISTYIRVLKADSEMYLHLGANVAEDISSDIYDEYYSMEKRELFKYLSKRAKELMLNKYMGSFPMIKN